MTNDFVQIPRAAWEALVSDINVLFERLSDARLALLWQESSEHAPVIGKLKFEKSNA